jgi:heme/copper-type cytochrome/quinol oxidase subunit 3
MMEATGKVLHLTRKMPAARRRQIAPNGVIGMMIFVVTELMFFGGMISAHSIVKNSAVGGWPPAGQPRLPIAETLLNTAALIVSGLLFWQALRAYEGGQRAMRRPLTLAIVLGAFFVLFQGAEWVALLREGLTLTSSTHGGFFYLIIGTHALHAVAGLAALIWCRVVLQRGDLLRTQLLTAGIFWGLVVGLWPILYWRVYL